MSDTTKTIQEECYGICWGAQQRIDELTQYLNESNQRIKRLEEARAVDDASSLATMLAYEIALAKIKHLEDIINRAHLAFFSDSSDRKVSIAMHRILDEEVRKEVQ